MDKTYLPSMDWNAPDMVEAFLLFKQRMNLYFNVQAVNSERKLDTVLLSIGLKGLQIYNSWTLSGSDNNIETVWSKFEKHFQPHSNIWLARLHLQRIKQRPEEPVDNFVARVKLQTQKCGTQDTREFNERVIETLISGVKYDIVQRDLLAKPNTLSLDEAIGMCRNYEVAADQLMELKDVQQNSANQISKEVDAIGAHKQFTPHRKCDYCGRSHPRGGTCPAFGTTCSNCGRRNHWAMVCRSRSQESQEHQQQPQRQQYNQHQQQPQRQQSTQQQQQPWRRTRHELPSNSPRNVHTVHEDPYFDEDNPSGIHMNNICIDTVSRDEATTDIRVQLPDRPMVRATMEVKVDTGAQGNVLPMRAFRVMCPDRMDSNQKVKVSALAPCTNTILTAYNGTQIPIYGMLTVNCRKNSTTPWSPHQFYVAETPGPIILGLPSCQSLGLVTLHCAMNVKQPVPVTNTEQLMKIYPTSFDTLGQFKSDYHIVVKPDAQPVVHAPRKCPIQMRDEIKRTLDDMEKLGVIRKVTEPTPWVSSLTYPRKSNGELRICLDPKDLNKNIMRTYHKTPTIEEITHKFHGSTVFSKLDAKNGYWSITLDRESQLLTTFNTPFARYCFTRMPFGLVMSQDVFQQRMDIILEQCPGTIGIADDVVVHGKNESEHDANLHRLMQVAVKEGLVFNSKKCDIRAEKIKFFGTIYDRNGAHPDPAKVKAINELPSPSTVSELQHVLGIVTYLSPFIQNLASHTSCLRELLKTDVEFKWTASHEAAFQTLKTVICNETSLAYFDPNADTTIQVDASGKGIGVAMFQHGKPIMYASKSLSDTEQRYACIEREMLAVCYGCTRFHTYIYGKRFTVETDHRPLTMIHLKNLTAAPPRLQRMLLRLQQYDVTIKYVPGKDLTIPDALSRLPSTNTQHIELDCSVHFVQFSIDRLNNLKSATNNDPTMCELRHTIKQGWPEKRRSVKPPLRHYWSMRDLLSVEDDLVLMSERIVIPPSMQQSILENIHAGHQGVTKSQLLAKSVVYWPALNRNIEQFVQSCETCQNALPSQPHEPLMQHDIPERAWQTVGTDLFHWNNSDYLLIVDYYSKFPYVKKLTTTTSIAVATMTKHVFSECGIPQRIVSDNGPQYSGAAYQEFVKEWGIEHVTSSPRYPMSNGMAERAIRTIKSTFDKAKRSGTDPYLALLCLRSTPISDTLPSPAELLMGRKVQTTVPAYTPCAPNQEQVHRALADRQRTQAYYHDKHAHKLPPLTRGDLVTVQHPHTRRWNRALIVTVCTDPRSYIIETENGARYRRNRRHIRRREPDPLPATADENPIPQPETTRTQFGRISKPPVRYSNWT